MPSWLSEEIYFDESLVDDWKGKYDIWYSPVEKEVAQFYDSIVRLLRPNVIIETGTNAGYSTARLANGLRNIGDDAIIYTFDMGAAKHIYEGTSLERYIRFIQGSSLEAPFDAQIVADMLVLDSDHSYGTIIRELLRFEPQLKVGGFILMHDSIYFDGVGYAVIQLMQSSRFEVVTLPTPRTNGIGSRSPGLSIIRKCLPTPAINDIVCNSEYDDIEVGRDQMDTEALIDKVCHKTL